MVQASNEAARGRHADDLYIEIMSDPSGRARMNSTYTRRDNGRLHVH